MPKLSIQLNHRVGRKWFPASLTRAGSKVSFVEYFSAIDAIKTHEIPQFSRVTVFPVVSIAIEPMVS